MLLSSPKRKKQTNPSTSTVEVWKTLNEYPDHEVSNFGGIRRKGIDQNITVNYGMKYPTVILTKKDPKIPAMYRILRAPLAYLILNTFLPSSTDDVLAYYKDGNKHNNNLDNLFWATNTTVQRLSRNSKKHKPGPKPKDRLTQTVSFFRILIKELKKHNELLTQTVRKEFITDISDFTFTLVNLQVWCMESRLPEVKDLMDWRMRNFVKFLVRENYLQQSNKTIGNQSVKYHIHKDFHDEWQLWEYIFSGDIALATTYYFDEGYIDHRPLADAPVSLSENATTEEDTDDLPTRVLQKPKRAEKNPVQPASTVVNSEQGATEFGWDEEFNLERALQTTYEMSEDEEIRKEIKNLARTKLKENQL